MKRIETKEQLIAELRKAREAKGISQKALAKILGVNVTSISHMEMGIKQPRSEKILKIAEAVGVGIYISEINIQK